MLHCLRLTAALACLVCSLTAGAQTRELSSSGQLLDGIAAVVNDGVVLKSELQVEIERIVQRLRSQGTPLPPPQTLAEQVLDRLVIQRLQLQRAERVGIQISDETLNQALATVAQRNNVSIAALPDVLAKEGVDYAAYRADLRNQIIMEQLRQRDVLGRIAVSPKEVDEYLARQAGKAGENQEYLLSHILIAVSPTANPDEVRAAESRIDDVAAKVAAGEDFGKLAVAYSDGQQALEGGSLGWRKGSELPSVFAEVVPGLERGQVSEVVRSGSGFHLIRLDDRRGGEPIMEKQTRARHILIKTNEVQNDDSVRETLRGIRQRILDGEDFAAVARAVSEDEQSAVDGGELGWSPAGSFVPEFEKTMESLALGEISEPFKTQFGWHILQVEERRVYDATADRERQQAIMAIRNSKLGEETEVWARRLRDEAYVETRM